MPHVYIVRCADDSLYTGWAIDLARRVKAHNAGRGARYTRTHGPVTLVYAEEVSTRGDALRRERVIKTYPRARKLALCGLEIPVLPTRRRAKKQGASPQRGGSRRRAPTPPKPASGKPASPRSRPTKVRSTRGLGNIKHGRRRGAWR